MSNGVEEGVSGDVYCLFGHKHPVHRCEPVNYQLPSAEFIQNYIATQSELSNIDFSLQKELLSSFSYQAVTTASPSTSQQQTIPAPIVDEPDYVNDIDLSGIDNENIDVPSTSSEGIPTSTGDRPISLQINADAEVETPSKSIEDEL